MAAQKSNSKANTYNVIVNSGGKTGSSSLYYSFHKMNVIALHTHGNDYLQRIVYKTKNVSLESIINEINLVNVKPLIISCYREPISRKISSFFENIERHMKMPKEQILRLNIHTILAQFLKLFISLETTSPHMEENGRYFAGINIFQKPFDKKKGFNLYENNKAKVLMLRFDKISEFEKIIRENTEFKNFKLIEHNISSKKWYSNLYQLFKNKLVIPKYMLAYVFEKQDKKNLEYFYDVDFINKIKSYWYNKKVI